MIIDAHAHVVPEGYPSRDGFPLMQPVDGDTARMLVFGATRFRARDVFFRTEQRIAAMDAAGVDQEIVSPMPPLLNYALEPTLGLDLARHINETIASHIRDGGGRIRGLGTVPLQDVDAASVELSTLRALGLDGVEVASHIAGVPIGDERFVPFFQEVDRLGLSVFVHSLPRHDEVGVAPGLRASIGVGIEGARGAASLILGETAQRCALERVLFSHAGGGLPLMLARADHFWHQQPAETRPSHAPSAVARRFFYDAMLFDPRALRFAVDYLGADRIVLGTDFPAMDRRGRLADVLDEIGVSAREMELIGSENARAFLSFADATTR